MSDVVSETPPPPPSGPPTWRERLRAFARRRWVRRCLIGAGVVAALLLVLRLLLPWIVPAVLDSVAGELDLTCEVERLELSLLAGEVELGGLTLAPREGGPAVVVLRHLRADLATSQLLRGRVHLRRLDLDGLALRLDRTAEGAVPLWDRLLAAAGRRPPAEEQEEEEVDDEEPPLPDLTALRIDAIRLSGLALEWTDAAALPGPHRAVVAGSFELSDLRPGSGQPGAWKGELEVRPGLDRLRVEGTSLLEPERLSTRGTVELRGLRPRELEPLLALVGASPRAGLVEGELSFDGEVAPVGTGRDLSLRIGVGQARLVADGETALGLEELVVRAPRLSKTRVELAELVVSGPRAALRRDPDGAACLAGVGFGGARSATPALRLELPQEKEKQKAKKPANLPALALGALRVSGGALRFQDEAIAPASSLALLLPRLSLGGLSWDPSGTGAGESAAAIGLAIEAPGVLQGIAGEGTLTPVGRRLSLDLALRADGLDAGALRPWLAAAGLEPACAAGELRAGLGLAIEPRPDGSLACDAALANLSFKDGATELLALRRVEAAGVTIAPEPLAIEVATLRLAGLRARAGRDRSGAAFFLGLRERAAPRPARAEQVEPDAPPATPAATGGSPEPRVRIGRVALEDLALAWEDGWLEPPRTLELGGGFELGELLHQPGVAGAPAKLEGRFALPGVAEEVRFTGTLGAGKAPALRATVEMSRVHLSGAAPYLAPLGIEPALEDGRLSFEVAADLTRAPGELGADATLSRLELADARRSWIRLEQTGLAARVVLPTAGQRGRIELTRLGLSGLRAGARLLPGGAVEVAGLRLARPEERRPAERAPRRVPTTDERAQRPPAAGGSPLPLLALAGARAEDVVLVVEDLAGETAHVVTATLAAELAALELDPSGPPPAQESAWKVVARAPGLVDRLELAGGLALGGRGARLSARLVGEGATAAALVERLHGLGLEPALDPPGQLAGELALAARLDPATSQVGADLAITGVAWRSGATELLGLDALRVSEVRAAPGRVEVGGVLVERPRMLLERAPSGAIKLLGLALVPAAPVTSGTATSPSPPPAPRPPGGDVASGGSSALVFRLGGLEVQGGRLLVRAEREGQPTETLALEAGLRLGALTAAAGAEPAPLELELAVPGALERLRVAGELVPDPEATRLTLRVEGRGISGERLGPWLGPGVALELRDGRLTAGIAAELHPHPGGGKSGRAALTGLELREGEDGPPLLRLAEVAAVVSRLDVERIELSRLAATGLEAALALAEDGTARACGLRLAPPPPPAGAPPQPPAPAARARLPHLAIDALELSAAKLTVARPRAAPVELGLRLVEREPLRLGGPQAAGHPPLRLLLEASLAPIVSSLALELEAAPLSPRPSLGLQLTAGGISGSGLVAALPELAAGGIDAQGLRGGRLQLRLAAEARPISGDPMDWSAGLSGRLALEELSFRDDGPAGPSDQVSGVAGPLLFGLRRLEVDLRRLKPGEPVHVRSVELEQPAGRLRISKDARGGEWLHACGLAIPIAPPPPPPDAPPPAAPPPDAPPPPPPPPPPPAPPPPALRLDHLGVSGIDLLVEDARRPTPVLVPLSDLEVDLDGLRLAQGAHPIRFEVALGLGRGRRGSITWDAPALAQEVRAKGELVLTSSPGGPGVKVGPGRIRAEVSDLRLLGLAPLAAVHKVTIQGGLLDLRSDTQLFADGRLNTSTRVLLTDLSMSEPEGGPVRRWLKLPAPLDLVIGRLDDEAGTIEIPLELELGASGELSWGELTSVLGSVLGNVLWDALKNVPDKAWAAARTVGSLIPGLKRKDDPAARDAVTLEFTPGETVLGSAEAAKLRALLRAMQRKPELVLQVRHDLGGGDLSHLARLTAPPGQDVRDALGRLEGRRAEIERYRADAAAEVRFGLRTGLEAQARAASRRLALLEQELGGLLRARDELSALLREGGDSQARARIRAAAAELGQARLDAARAAVLAAGLPGLAERIEVARPRFDPAEGSRGGTVTLTPRPKKE